MASPTFSWWYADHADEFTDIWSVKNRSFGPRPSSAVKARAHTSHSTKRHRRLPTPNTQKPGTPMSTPQRIIHPSLSKGSRPSTTNHPSRSQPRASAQSSTPQTGATRPTTGGSKVTVTFPTVKNIVQPSTEPIGHGSGILADHNLKAVVEKEVSRLRFHPIGPQRARKRFGEVIPEAPDPKEVQVVENTIKSYNDLCEKLASVEKIATAMRAEAEFELSDGVKQGFRRTNVSLAYLTSIMSKSISVSGNSKIARNMDADEAATMIAAHVRGFLTRAQYGTVLGAVRSWRARSLKSTVHMFNKWMYSWTERHQRIANLTKNAKTTTMDTYFRPWQVWTKEQTKKRWSHWNRIQQSRIHFFQRTLRRILSRWSEVSTGQMSRKHVEALYGERYRKMEDLLKEQYGHVTPKMIREALLQENVREYQRKQRRAIRRKVMDKWKSLRSKETLDAERALNEKEQQLQKKAKEREERRAAIVIDPGLIQQMLLEWHHVVVEMKMLYLRDREFLLSVFKGWKELFRMEMKVRGRSRAVGRNLVRKVFKEMANFLLRTHRIRWAAIYSWREYGYRVRTLPLRHWYMYTQKKLMHRRTQEALARAFRRRRDRWTMRRYFDALSVSDKREARRLIQLSKTDAALAKLEEKAIRKRKLLEQKEMLFEQLVDAKTKLKANMDETFEASNVQWDQLDNSLVKAHRNAVELELRIKVAEEEAMDMKFALHQCEMARRRMEGILDGRKYFAKLTGKSDFGNQDTSSSRSFDFELPPMSEHDHEDGLTSQWSDFESSDDEDVRPAVWAADDYGMEDETLVLELERRQQIRSRSNSISEGNEGSKLGGEPIARESDQQRSESDENVSRECQDGEADHAAEAQTVEESSQEEEGDGGKGSSEIGEGASEDAEMPNEMDDQTLTSNVQEKIEKKDVETEPTDISQLPAVVNGNIMATVAQMEMAARAQVVARQMELQENDPSQTLEPRILISYLKTGHPNILTLFHVPPTVTPDSGLIPEEETPETINRTLESLSESPPVPGNMMGTFTSGEGQDPIVAPSPALVRARIDGDPMLLPFLRELEERRESRTKSRTGLHPSVPAVTLTPPDVGVQLPPKQTEPLVLGQVTFKDIEEAVERQENIESRNRLLYEGKVVEATEHIRKLANCLNPEFFKLDDEEVKQRRKLAKALAAKPTETKKSRKVVKQADGKIMISGGL